MVSKGSFFFFLVGLPFGVPGSSEHGRTNSESSQHANIGRIGSLNSQRQPRYCVMMPPTPIPMDDPSVPVAVCSAEATPRAAGSRPCAIKPNPAGPVIPHAMPCTTRETSMIEKLGA